MDLDHLITTKEAADRIGVRTESICRFIRDRILTPYEYGTRGHSHLFDPDDVDDFAEFYHKLYVRGGRPGPRPGTHTQKKKDA